jgi:predicted Zn-dependent peptidase
MYKRVTLTNGIRVITEFIPYVNSISIGFWIGSGSRYENNLNNGVSHFIEHMLFKGTKNRSSKQIAEEIESLGGQINAFTGKEATCFYVKLLDEHFETGIDVLCDMIMNPKFSNEDIEKEKGVVQEEINMYEDSPEDLVMDILSRITWKDDTLAYPILGTSQSLRNLTRESVMEYYNHTYVPENMVISVAGNFKEEELIGKLEDKLWVWRKDASGPITLSSPRMTKDIVVKSKDIEQVHLALTFNGIELGDKSLYALFVVNNYLGGGTSSRLFQTLREEKGYVYTIYSFPSSYMHAGTYTIYLALNEQYLDDAVKLIREELKELTKKRMTDEQIRKAKEQLKGNYILGLESISSRMFGIGKAELLQGVVHEPKDILEKIDEITPEDVYQVIDKVFSEGILSASGVGRNISKERLRTIVHNG